MNYLDTLTSLNKEFAETSEKLMKGYDLLKEVKDVDVATAHKELVWQLDKVKLYRYKNDNVKCKTPLIVSYALVNRFDMMDLQPDRSFVRNLLKEGMDIYMIDWGYATKADRYTTFDEYVLDYLGGAVDFVRKSEGIDKVNLLGVCQGGTFAAIYTALKQEKVKNLVTLVAPFDFDTPEGLLFKWSKDMDVDQLVDSFNGLIPGEFLNSSYEMLKPMGKMRKFHSLPSMLEDEAKLMNFLRMEKWVADSPAQSGECFRKFIKELYQENRLIKGELVIGGKKVDLSKITIPVMNIYAESDHIVPPSATKPLNDVIGSKDKELYKFQGGHIGVFVGGRSQKELGPAVADFLTKRS